MAAERYFDGVEAAIGRSRRRPRRPRGDRRATIVGVVADTRDSQLTRVSPQIYVPLDQWPAKELRAVVRADEPSARASATFRR